MTRSTAAPEKLVGALSSGLSVLRYLAATASPVGVTRIARDLELNSSTCFNLLKTLVHERLVSFDERTKTYAISIGLVELAKGALEQASVVRMLRPHLEAIAQARAQSLLADHRRVREAAEARGSYQVTASLPVDVMGVYVLVPAAVEV